MGFFNLGGNENGDLIDYYCGNTTLPSPIASSSRAVWIRFVSDAIVHDQGFKLQYQFTSNYQRSKVLRTKLCCLIKIF